MSTKRLRRLVPKGGVEIFQVRIAVFIGPDGTIDDDTEILTPDEEEPRVGDVLEALRQARRAVLVAYEGEDDEG